MQPDERPSRCGGFGRHSAVSKDRMSINEKCRKLTLNGNRDRTKNITQNLKNSKFLIKVVYFM